MVDLGIKSARDGRPKSPPDLGLFQTFNFAGRTVNLKRGAMVGVFFNCQLERKGRIEAERD